MPDEDLHGIADEPEVTQLDLGHPPVGVMPDDAFDVLARKVVPQTLVRTGRKRATALASVSPDGSQRTPMKVRLSMLLAIPHAGHGKA